MNYKQHILVGLVFSIISLFIMSRYFSVNIAIQDILVSLLICICYSILPDVDTPASKARQGVTIGLGVLGLYFLLNSKIILASVLSMVSLLLIWMMDFVFNVKHRGVFHTVPFAFLLSVPIMFLGIPVFIIAFISYLSHLLADEVFHARS